MKNRIYPVWISWEGKEEEFEMAKTSIIQDIINSGFSHYDAYVDLVEDAGKDKDWDGAQRDVPTELKPKGSPVTPPVNPPTKPSYDTRTTYITPEDSTILPKKSGGSSSDTTTQPTKKTASK
jgi:hypothetical protein